VTRSAAIEPILEVRRVTRRFSGLTAVNDVSFQVAPGEIVGVIGPNGAGKTTLFAVISGFLKPTAGEVLFRGQIISGLPAHRICELGLTRTFQIVQPFPGLTTLENVAVGAFVRERSKAASMRQAAAVLEQVGLAHKAHVPARDLTLLERKRLEIAKALATAPSVLLLDEVAAGLNDVEVEEVMELVRAVNEAGVTILMIEHIVSLVSALCRRIIVLNFGRKIAEGSPEEIRANPAVIEAYLGSDD